jgi:uncharacterized protein (DUF1501 family)
LVPHSQCDKVGKEMYDEYKTVRTNVAIPKADLLEIDVAAKNQPCDKFGLNPSLVNVARMYREGNAAFVANTGPMVEPVTKETWEDGSAKLPTSLFAHNIQQEAIQSIVPQASSSHGVLGRMFDGLTAQGFNVGSFSIDGNNLVQMGQSGAAPSPDVVSQSGNVPVYSAATLSPGRAARVQQVTYNLTESCSSLFGETWGTAMRQTLNRGAILSSALQGSDPTTEFPQSNLGAQFEQVVRGIKGRMALKTNRNSFFVRMEGYDTHGSPTELNFLMAEVDEALAAFETEMKLQGLWENVVVVTASDFGRTLTSNGQGTDHAWGGNSFVVGGSVKGGQIHGKYPDDLTDDGKLNIGRGRLIPTTSLDAMWNGVSKWMGVSDAHMDKVLPNRGNFPTESLLSEADMFE